MMKNLSGKDHASLAYGLNMLRLLLSMKLITEEEYNQIKSLNLKTFQPAEAKLYEKNSRCVTEKQVSFA